MIKANQNNIHIYHKFIVLSFSFFEISDKIDWIIEIFHQVAQFITLHNKKIQKLFVIAIKIDERKLQTTDISKIGFLPNLSANCHKIGANKKEKRLYIEIDKDTINHETLKKSVKSGNAGTKIQIDKTSINQIKRIINFILNI